MHDASSAVGGGGVVVRHGIDFCCLKRRLRTIAVDSLIDKVNSVIVGCFLSTIHCNVFLNADDILLLAPTVTGLQILLSVRERELFNLDMRINVRKQF